MHTASHLVFERGCIFTVFTRLNLPHVADLIFSSETNTWDYVGTLYYRDWLQKLPLANVNRLKGQWPQVAALFYKTLSNCSISFVVQVSDKCDHINGHGMTAYKISVGLMWQSYDRAASYLHEFGKTTFQLTNTWDKNGNNCSLPG